MRFVDTNLLIYAVAPRPNEDLKARRANAILAERDLGLSSQVLQEFYLQATRPGLPGVVSHEVALGLVESFLRYPIQPITPSLVLAAIATGARFQISYWDAAIIEAARALRCEVVLSEDLSAGQDYDGVRVENPFGDV